MYLKVFFNSIIYSIEQVKYKMHICNHEKIVFHLQMWAWHSTSHRYSELDRDITALPIAEVNKCRCRTDIPYHSS